MTKRDPALAKKHRSGPARRPFNRRKFLTELAKTACGVSLFALAVGINGKQSRALPANALRPRGALPESDFLAACTRCGMCVEDCPYDILKLAQLGDGIPNGTPYFNARTGPCAMCEDIPCIKACLQRPLIIGLLTLTRRRWDWRCCWIRKAALPFRVCAARSVSISVRCVARP